MPDIRFSNGFVLLDVTKNNIIQKVFDALKKELPEEALNCEVLEYVLQETQEKLKIKKLEL